MRVILTLIIFLLIIVSCGKKSEPKYQGLKYNLINKI